jgi:hypothetical protein
VLTSPVRLLNVLRDPRRVSLLELLCPELPDEFEKMPGMYRVTRGRRQGRQEHMIPMFVSMDDQVAAGGLS